MMNGGRLCLPARVFCVCLQRFLNLVRMGTCFSEASALTLPILSISSALLVQQQPRCYDEVDKLQALTNEAINNEIPAHKRNLYIPYSFASTALLFCRPQYMRAALFCPHASHSSSENKMQKQMKNYTFPIALTR